MTYIPKPSSGVVQPSNWPHTVHPAPMSIHPAPLIANPSALAPFTGAFTVANKVNLGEAFKPKRAGKATSHVVFVLDDSSSMMSCQSQTIAGYNEYLKGQKEDAIKTGIKTYVSLYKFNGYSVNRVFDHVEVSAVEDLTTLTYRPSGSTNLHDAIGGVMMSINEILSLVKKKERESVIITILTDGGENSSITFNNDAIKQMVEKAEGKNWGFMFLGANINAFDTSSALGFNAANTLQFNNANATEAIRSASAMTARMKSAYAAGVGTQEVYGTTAFLNTERSDSVGK